MPIERDATLKKAEKLARQGKLDAAIAEYLRVVEDQPRDWTTANTLGDLYVRAGQPDKASEQFARIAEHFMAEGFFPKAAAVYKKLLKISPDDEQAQLNLAEISQKQGLLADAKARLNAVAARRRDRGDRPGTAEIVVRLGALDPADFEARTAGARTLVEMGRIEEASERFRLIYEDLIEKERPREALEALRQSVDLNPADRDGRAVIAGTLVQAGDYEAARHYLDRETAGDDPSLQMALVELELKAGRTDAARELLPSILLAGGSERRAAAMDLAWALAPSDPAAAFVVVEAVTDAAAARGEFVDAAAALQEFVTRVPRQIPALLKLVEICVDGGLESAMYEAQAELADAYLATGQATEARTIAEDLVAREPWERAHLERFRRALVMLKVPDPDTVIADRLSGAEPFVARDVFASHAFSTPEPAIEEPDYRGAEDTAEAGPAAGDEGQEADAEAGQPWEGAADLSGALGSPEAIDPPDDPEANQAAFAAVFGDSAAPPPDAESDVAEEQLALARTYLEMNMPEEALVPLQEAFKTPRFRFEAAAMLGRLHLQRGDTGPAIEWLERAASTAAPTRDDGHAVLYELGTLIEESGDTSRALALFIDLQADAGEYRDVGERVERLTRVEMGG